MTPDDITRLVCQKLQRFADCAEDGNGCDIGREWFDALTLLGLLERTKRSPAEWMMTPAGHDTLAAQGKAGGVADEDQLSTVENIQAFSRGYKSHLPKAKLTVHGIAHGLRALERYLKTGEMPNE